MRKPMVAGNWKMNGSGGGARLLLGELIKGCEQFEERTEIVVCPPFVYLDRSSELLAGQRSIVLGAQNLDCHESGAYTGEISGSMLLDVGCRYVIVGHSERRSLYDESNELVASKVEAALEAGLTPILCLGETLAQREAGETMAKVGDQLDTVVDAVGVEALAGFIVAYEPVWAIGTGRTATPDQAQEVHQFIRSRLCSRDEGLGAGTRILYGGSVKPDNALELFSRPDIDGGLIGGASLNAQDFLTICSAAG